MEAVADRFDTNGDGFIDYREFIAALRWPARVSQACHILTIVTKSSNPLCNSLEYSRLAYYQLQSGDIGTVCCSDTFCSWSLLQLA